MNYTRNMFQVATYWQPGLDHNPQTTDAFGNVNLLAPVPIMCRAQEKIDLVRDANGREVTSTHIVYSDRYLAPGGWLEIGGNYITPDPRTRRDAREIINSAKSPSLDNRKVLHKAWL